MRQLRGANGARVGPTAPGLLTSGLLTSGLLALGILALGLAAGGPGTRAAAATHSTRSAPAPGVGVLTVTYVDRHRSTPAWAGTPQTPRRTLVTTVFYPAASPRAGRGSGSVASAPDRADAPYPLVVFAHGFGADPESYAPLLRHWAKAGFVVAAPRFPLTSDATTGGPDEADVVNQPADMSFVVTSVLRDAGRRGPLAGLVDPHEVGAAGHSNGGVTTLGLIANTCCHDARLKAAVVMSGAPAPFRGRYDYALAPPTLVVHGTADQLVPYNGAVEAFDRLRGPKGMLTLVGGDHGAGAGFSSRSGAAVRATTTDFLAAYLKGDTAARTRLRRDGQPGVAVLHFSTHRPSRLTVPTIPTPVRHLRARVSPHEGLRAGQQVTVTWSGYTPGKVVNVLQCSGGVHAPPSETACTFSNASLLHADPTGSGSLSLAVVMGPVGTGRCDAAHPCTIVVNDASSTDPASSLRLPISFAG